MPEPKVSIIIPVYNDEDNLSRCLDSVANQTLQDIEILCIDDASTDSSPFIIEEYNQKYPCIKSIRFEQNSSAYMARKAGISRATGKYIMFVDGDDYLSIDACEKIYKIAEKKKVDILNFSSESVNAGTTEKKNNRMNRHLRPFYGKLTGSAIIDFCFIHHEIQWTLWNKIYSSAVCKKAVEELPDGYFPKGNDLFLYLAICACAVTYRGIHTKPYYFYQYGAGSTGNRIIGISDLKKLVEQKKLSDAVSIFISGSSLDSKYLCIANDLDVRFLRESLTNLFEHLPEETIREGYLLIEQYWKRHVILKQILQDNAKKFREYINRIVTQGIDQIIVEESMFIHHKYFKSIMNDKTKKKSIFFRLQQKIERTRFYLLHYGFGVYFGLLRKKTNI